MSLNYKQILILSLLLSIIICSFWIPIPNCFSQDPLGPKLKVEGDIEIEAGGLRLKPVVDSPPANPEVGDLYFDGSTLYTWDGNIWQTFAATDKGNIFYNNTNNTLYFYDGTSWEQLGAGGEAGEGPKAVATKIVAASNSLDTECNGGSCTNPRADHTCDGTRTTGGDQVEINDALTEVSNAGGGSVYLLEGNYWISGIIYVPSNVAIIGSGHNTVISLKDGTSSTWGFIRNSDQTNGNDHILLENFKVDGNKANNAGTTHNGIRFDKVTHSKINNLWVENTTRDGIVLRVSSNNNIISGCNVQFNGYRGIALYFSCNNNIVSGNDVQSNSDIGINLESEEYSVNGNNNNIISGNNVQDNDDYGIRVGVSSNGNVISGNNVELNTYGIVINKSSSNNTIFGNNVHSNSGIGITVDNNDPYTDTNYNTVCGNNVYLNGGTGIRVAVSAHSNIISGNVIYDNGGTDNRHGVNIYDNCDNNLISSNRISDTAGATSGGTAFMISIAHEDCENNYIVGNEITFPATATGNIEELYDAGTNTTYTQKEKMTLEKKEISISSSSYNLDVTTNPQTYVYLTPSVDTTLTLTDGKAAGDYLIIENGSSNKITINDNTGNVNLGANRELYQNDILGLIWNGTVAEGGTGKWLEVKYVKNSP